MSNEEIIARLKKMENILKADTAVSDGLMNPEQASSFIQETIDQSQFLSTIDVQRMQRDKKDISTIGLASRVLRPGVTGTDPDVTDPDIGKRSMDTVETILAVNIDFETLEENIEEEGFEQTINDIFTRQFANDLTDLAWNGKEDSGDDFLEINDGYLEIADTDSGANAVAFAGNDTAKQVFRSMLTAMPDKHKINPKLLAYFVSPTMREDYIEELGDRATALGDKVSTEAWTPTYHGIPVIAVPYISSSRAMLTDPKNLKMGWHKRYIRVGRWINERKRRVEYTITTKCDFEYALSSQIVLATKP